MTPEVAQSVLSFFRSLECYRDAYIYTENQRKEFLDLLDSLLENWEITLTQKQLLTFWVHSIRLGDLDDWCAAYYYNVNARRMAELEAILNSMRTAN